MECRGKRRLPTEHMDKTRWKSHAWNGCTTGTRTIGLKRKLRRIESESKGISTCRLNAVSCPKVGSVDLRWLQDLTRNRRTQCRNLPESPRVNPKLAACHSTAVRTLNALRTNTAKVCDCFCQRATTPPQKSGAGGFTAPAIRVSRRVQMSACVYTCVRGFASDCSFPSADTQKVPICIYHMYVQMCIVRLCE